MEEDFYIDYNKLDSIQRAYIDRKVNKSMVIAGDAGSGKSLIALHKAKIVSALGSYAIIVYTKSLKKYFEDGLKSLGLKNVYYYNEWKKDYDKWRNNYNKRPVVKYLIVDECQDFSSDEICELRKFGEICFFFGDTNQSIMSFRKALQSVEDTARAIGVGIDSLYRNYRLTVENALLAEEIGEVEDVVDKCFRHGEKPRIFEADSIDGQLDKIASIIKNRRLTNVGILMRHNTMESAQNHSGNSKLSVEYAKNYFEKKGLTVEFKYNANMDTAMDLDFHSSNPKILTWWCAKGLQFNDVFIPACNFDYDDAVRSAMYVAVTRTSERLYLCYSDSLMEWFPEESSDLYGNAKASF